MMTYQTETFKLPCGYLDENGLLYTHIEVREMTGKEEDILSDRKKLKSGVSINQVMANCCTLIMLPDEKKSEVRIPMTPEMTVKLTQGDRYFILIKLRQVSHGDEYKFELSCPQCDKKNVATIPLSSLAVKEMPTPLIRHYDFVAPSASGKGEDKITYRITTGEDEVKMTKLLEQNPDKLASINLATRIVTVNGEAVRPLQYLQQFPARVLDKFRAAIQEVEGGVETRLTGLECVSCHAALESDLPLQASFFLPQSSK